MIPGFLYPFFFFFLTKEAKILKSRTSRTFPETNIDTITTDQTISKQNYKPNLVINVMTAFHQYQKKGLTRLETLFDARLSDEMA